MSDADRVQVTIAKETTFGVAATGAYESMRITAESLAANAGYVQSNELDSSRQITGFLRNDFGAGGNLEFEFSFGGGATSAFNLILLGLMFQTAWSSPVTNSGTFSATAATRTFSGTDVAAGLIVGQWVKVAGFSAAVDGYYKVATVASDDAFTVVQAVAADVTGTGDESVVMGSQLVNGTTFSSYTIQKQFQDLTDDWEAFTGMAVEQLDLRVNVDGIVTGTVGWIGKGSTSQTSNLGSSINAAPLFEVMNAIDNVVGMFEDGSSISLTNFNIQANNNLRGRKRIGELGPFSMGAGKYNITGSIEGYYEGPSRISKFLNDTPTSIAIVFRDSAGNAYVFDLPQVKFSSGTRNTTGTNTDVKEPLNFTAYRDPSELVTLRVVRFPAA